MTLTSDEMDTVWNALAVFAHAHRREIENSPFPETVEHSRSEWIKAMDLATKIQKIQADEGDADVEI
tara:strand:- start:386 stop:586 length:201 start_codon:yes stop_codon:yes gene_type:complete